MSKKKANPAETAPIEPLKTERLQLDVGVNFIPLGETEEVRIEAGIIDLGTLPPAFEQELVLDNKARIVIA